MYMEGEGETSGDYNRRLECRIKKVYILYLDSSNLIFFLQEYSYFRVFVLTFAFNN